MGGSCPAVPQECDQTTLLAPVSLHMWTLDDRFLGWLLGLSELPVSCSSARGLLSGLILWIYVTDICFAAFIVSVVYALLPAKGICKNLH